MADHSPEPWSVKKDDSFLYDANGHCLNPDELGLPIVDAERIVACVNACRNLSDNLLALVNNGTLEVHLSLSGQPLHMVVPVDTACSVQGESNG